VRERLCGRAVRPRLDDAPVDRRRARGLTTRPWIYAAPTEQKTALMVSTSPSSTAGLHPWRISRERASRGKNVHKLTGISTCKHP
jgi:hypothetical protein